MNSRDDQILTHLGRYRLSFRRTLERLFFTGRVSACDNVLRRLQEQGRIRVVRGLPRRISYYTLSPTEAAHRGIPENRSRHLRPQALQQHLAVLWFCCMGPVPRVRLEPSELTAIEPSFPAWPQIVHCLERDKGPRVYQVLVMGPNSRPADLIARLRKRLAAESQHAAIGALSRRGLRGVAILAEHSGQRSALERAVQRHRLTDLAPVLIEFAPGPATLQGALHAR